MTVKRTEKEISSEIVGLFNKRDENAIVLLSDAFGKSFLRIAENITGNSQYSEEIVNEAYMKMWSNIPPAQPSSVLAYGMRIVRNLSIDRVRGDRAQKRPQTVAELDEAIPDEVPDALESKELGMLISDFLRNLDKDTRVMFVKRYYSEEKISDIAAFYGMKEETVKTKLRRTCLKLREYLKKEKYVL